VEPREVAGKFVERVNAHDVDGLAAMMTEDHRFIDALGESGTGREELRLGWEGYFKLVPDYRIEVEEVFSDGPVVVLLGTARGTYSPDGLRTVENSWQVPAAWRARIAGELVAEWRVYVDNDPLRRRMAAHGPEAEA
jgi:ketosteroid isomerase-like protein